MNTEPPSGHRSSKRPRVDDVPQRTKRPRTADSDADDGEDMDVDIDALRDSAERSLSAADDSRFLPEDPSPPHKAASKKRQKSSTKKKPQVVYSDDEASNSHLERDSVDDDLTDIATEASDDDTPPRRKAKAGGVGKVKPKGAKAKGLKDKDRDILVKDERKLAMPLATTSRGSSAAAQSQPLDLFSNDDLAPSSAVDPLPDASQPAKDPLSLTIPKKRKLPPIKKTKLATGATGTPTPTTQKPAPAPVQEPAKPLLPTSEQRKQALTGVRDVDLADPRTYNELFKGAGGITPKSGLKNAEERRKELDKMRDEARARRAEEAKFTFDLQSQADKIAHFEQRLRAENSTVLHPNFLAAKLRDEWELERRNRRATGKEEGEA